MPLTFITPKPNRPAPAAPAGGMSWAKTAAAGIPQGRMISIDGDFYCTIPKKDEAFITDTAIRIARDFNCSYVGIRAGIHNTLTYRDQVTREPMYRTAPWHFTAEFQHRVHGKWMSAHIYTDTYTAETSGFKYNRTNGVQKLERLKEIGIQKNPELFEYVNPKILRMRKHGTPFGRKFDATNYQPTNW